MTTTSQDSSSGGAGKPAVESAGPGGPSRGLDAARARHERANQRPKGNAGGGNGANRTGDNNRQVPAPSPAPQLYTAEALQGLLSLPFHAVALATDDARMALDEVEKKALADSGALVANAYLPVDPRASAMTLFLGTVAALSLARLGVWADIKKKAKEKADADTRSNGEAPRSPVLSQVS